MSRAAETTTASTSVPSPRAGGRRRRRWLLYGLGIIVLLAVLLAGIALLVRIEHAPLPAEASLLNPDRRPLPAYDVFGRQIGAEEAERLLTTEEGRRLLAAHNGAVRIDEDVFRHGREAFYRETFGNEVFLTDVLGLLDGAITPWAMMRATLAAYFRGGTDYLAVRLARDKQVGDRLYERGEVVRTGLDLPRGSLFPLGVKVVWDRGRIRAGITCAACHSTVDRETGLVVEGAPNANLRVGLMMALASNSAAYFMHTGASEIEAFISEASASVATSTGALERLPDPDTFERTVAGMLAAWPPGNFDPTLDLVNNPTQIPDSFTAEDHPYGWTGFAAAGPFRGLSMLSNNVHGLNADATNEAAAAPKLFGLDPEVFLGTLLQRAANPRFRYDPADGRKPSEVLAAVDPNPEAPGLSQVVRLPTFPDASYMSSNGLVASVPGRPVAYDLDAISVFQNALLPPSAPPDPQPAEILDAGRAVFDRAGCAACHDGPAYSANRVLPVDEVGTQPSRAAALRVAAEGLQPPLFYPPSVNAPPSGNAPLIRVPIPQEMEDDLRLGWAQDEEGRGGYKTKGLIGLAWTAPYLHDGGVAVGPEAGQVGLPGTLLRDVRPDPVNSLRALLDRDLRARVVEANRAAGLEAAAQVSGDGHAHWVDAAAGYTPEDQSALVAYLLSLTRLRDEAPPSPPAPATEPASAPAPAPPGTEPTPAPAPAPATGPAGQ